MIKANQEPLKTAVIGAGGRVGAYYLNALERVGANVIAYDTNAERMDAAVSRHPGLHVARTMDEALEQAQVAYVLTPDHVRIGIADKAIRTPGMEVVVIEKPFADTLAAAKTIYDTAIDTGKKVIVGSTYRATPQFAAIKDGVDAGEIGRIVKITGTYDHDVRDFQDEWRTVGRGQNWYFGAGAHALDTSLHVSGAKIIEVTAMESRIGLVDGTDGYNRPELTGILARGENGEIIDLSFNFVTPAPQGQHGTRLEVFGTEGQYRAHNKVLPGQNPGEYLVFRQGEEDWETRSVQPAFAIDQLVKNADAWARNEVENPYPFATVREALDLTSVLDAAQTSAQNRRTERVLYHN